MGMGPSGPLTSAIAFSRMADCLQQRTFINTPQAFAALYSCWGPSSELVAKEQSAFQQANGVPARPLGGTPNRAVLLPTGDGNVGRFALSRG